MARIHRTTRVSKRLRRPLSRQRGVASILAMMFMVMFGSLAVAMAIASQGNLRTAATHMQVTRAMGAADTGMDVAIKRLQDACSRFVVERGTIDAGFANRMWIGNYSHGEITSGGDGEVRVLPPPSGHPEVGSPGGIIDALRNAFDADNNTVAMTGTPTSATIHTAPVGTDLTVFDSDHWLTTPVVAIGGGTGSSTDHPAGYQVTYAPLRNGTDIRIIVTGYASVGDATSSYHYGFNRTDGSFRPLTRVMQQDFRIVKRHGHAVLSPSRIMIGKNVQINGSIGGVFDDVTFENGHPVFVRSDFRGLSATLDAKLDAFSEAVQAVDGDGDGRLRVDHSEEGAGIPAGMTDVTGDGYVDEFDLFIAHYDTDGDGRLVLSTALTVGTPAEGLSPEFTADDDLALLIDSAYPDRNRNQVFGYHDANNNGRWDDGEALLDYDDLNDVYPDRQLGYRDGFIDRMDVYAKIRGSVVFRTTAAAWQAEHGDYQQYINGPIVPKAEKPAVEFGAGLDELPLLTADDFLISQSPLTDLADGQSFEQQVANELEINVASLATYLESDNDETQPRYFRADLDDAYVVTMTGQHIWEKMPFNAPTHTDYYYRPRYENMTFRNVQIPEGNNGLFVNCTFVGVTWIRSYQENTHDNWAIYGRMDWDPSLNRPVYSTGPFDKSDFLRYTTGNVADGPDNYDDFPDPPTIHGVLRTKDSGDRNTKLYSNNIRFHDCLFIGSVVSDAPAEYTHARNKLQFTGATRFLREHPTDPYNPDFDLDDDEAEETAKSSLMLPNYSVDIGQFNSPTDTYTGTMHGDPQDVRLQGTIVAGILDVRGNARIDGSLVLTFQPVLGEGPLQQYGEPVGNPAAFNATLGYFGPEDGDAESLDPEGLTIHNGERIVGWDTDGDGLPDVPHNQPQPAGSEPIPFYGYGRIILNWDPSLPMPDGIMLPLSAQRRVATYREGRD